MHKEHKDPQPGHGNDQKGHHDNGKGNGGGQGRPSRPSKPGNSHPSVAIWNSLLFKD
jgi:hypothetical protein